MATNLDKLHLDNKIALSFYKNRGNIASVCEEVKDVHPDYIIKVMNKLRKKLHRDVSYYLSVSIGGTIWSGIQQRTAHLTECLDRLRNVERAEVSVCCDAPTKETEEGQEKFHSCLKCSKRTSLHTIFKYRILELVVELIRELREEDKFSLEFADKMGFTLKDALPPAPVFNQNVFVVGGGKRPVTFSKDDQPMLQELDSMSQQERGRTRKALELRLLEESPTDGQTETD